MNHIENCQENNMHYYSFFFLKLKQIEKKAKIINFNNNKYYQFYNFKWIFNLKNIIKNNKKYPSEKFINFILSLEIINNYLINPPILINKKHNMNIYYIKICHNDLQILDALFKHGSYRKYLYNKKFIFSEHFGAIKINNNIVDKIIIYVNSNRIDKNDQDIYLPLNNNSLNEYEIIFHTHPNSEKYLGRLNNGILYEFPSPNDIINFINYYNNGKCQVSLIISPEGIYLLRILKYCNKIKINENDFKILENNIINIENDAIKELNKYIKKIFNEDDFHKYISYNFKYLKKYNKILLNYGLFVEYYPRIKKHNEWYLRNINIQLLKYN